MKIITQIIALLIVTENILQIAIAAISVFFGIKFLTDHVKDARNKSIARKRRKAFDNNMWAIN